METDERRREVDEDERERAAFRIAACSVAVLAIGGAALAVLLLAGLAWTMVGAL